MLIGQRKIQWLPAKLLTCSNYFTSLKINKTGEIKQNMMTDTMKKKKVWHTHKFYTGAQNFLRKVERAPLLGGRMGIILERYWATERSWGKDSIHAEEATAIKTVSLTANCDNGEIKMFKIKLQLDKGTLF